MAATYGRMVATCVFMVATYVFTAATCMRNMKTLSERFRWRVGGFGAVMLRLGQLIAASRCINGVVQLCKKCHLSCRARLICRYDSRLRETEFASCGRETA